MKRLWFLLFTLCVMQAHAEDLEYLWTSTSVYSGVAGLTGASAYTMPNENSSYVGWIWFPEGFTIASGTTSSFNIVAPVDGVINVNDGTLTLTGDMHLGTNAVITGDGNVDGNGYGVILHDQLSLNSVLTFIGDTIIDGDSNTLTLTQNAELWIDNNVTLTLQNMTLKNLNDTLLSKIVMVGPDSKLVFDNVSIWLDGDYSFTQGSMFFYNDVTIAGSTHKLSYLSTGSSFISAETVLAFDHGLTFSYDPAGSYRELIQMADNTSHLVLDSCLLYSTTAGLMLTNGTVIFDGLVNLSADGQVVSEAIAFGDSSGNDLTTIVLPGAQIKVYGYIDIN